MGAPTRASRQRASQRQATISSQGPSALPDDASAAVHTTIDTRHEPGQTSYETPQPSETQSCGINSNTARASEIDPLGAGVKEAVEVISRLEGLGLSKLQIPIPKCIVLGEFF